MKDNLSEEGKKLLTAIVTKIVMGDLFPERPETYIGYKEAHDLMGIALDAPRWDASLKNHGLVDLAEWTTKNDIPKVTGLIVNQQSLKPGKGYYRLFGKSEDDEQWWHNQARESILFDWSDYVVGELELPTRSEFIEFERAITEGTIKSLNARVRERCERLKKRAKAYHSDGDGILKCKACGWYNFAPASFVGDVVEMHHIEAIGSQPIEGKKWSIEGAIKNLVPLCPTCHRLIHALPNHQSYSLEDLVFLLNKYAPNVDAK